MEILDENAMEELGQGIVLCAASFKCGPPRFMCGPALERCTPRLCRLLGCGNRLWEPLTDGLTACGEGFYVKCPGFERIERYCDFEPAIEAAKWKEKVDLDKIAKLEAKVQELEMALKKKG